MKTAVAITPSISTMELLFESTGDFRFLSCSSNQSKSSTEHDIVAVAGKSIVIVDSESCETLLTINMASWADILSCVRLHDGSLLVALADSSLLLIPVGCANTSSLKNIKWPTQPIGLLALSTSVIITCAYNILCEVSISDLSTVPDLVKISDKSSNIVSTRGMRMILAH